MYNSIFKMCRKNATISEKVLNQINKKATHTIRNICETF